jgi:hypothetical protein
MKEVLQQLRRHANNTSEWVASSTNKINKMDVLKSQFATTAAKSYEDRLFLNQSLQERFSDIKDGTILCTFPIDFKEISTILKNEHNVLEKRQALLTDGFFVRKLMAIDMLFNGEYKYFNGLKSFARDFLR